MKRMKKNEPGPSYHDRRLARRLKDDPDFRAEYKRWRTALKTGL